jgi:hypothetical protein
MYGQMTHHLPVFYFAEPPVVKARQQRWLLP